MRHWTFAPPLRKGEQAITKELRMGVATRTDLGRVSEWRIDDEPMELRVWGTEIAHRLPRPAPGESDGWIIGAAADCWLQLMDPLVSRQHARLVRVEGRWGIKDLKSKNGLREDGARRDAFPLVPGTEIGLGGVTLIAESRQLRGLREVVARVIGWTDDRRGEVDLAVRAVRMAATRREVLRVCGDGDLVAVARLLHRHALGDDRPFVVCDPRRRASDPGGRAAANFDELEAAIGAAAGGTLCVWNHRLPTRFAEAVAAVRGPGGRIQLIVCGHAPAPGEPAIASPIVVPPLARRAAELSRIIAAYAVDAAAELGGALDPADAAWIRSHEVDSLAQIEIAVRRLVALRNGGGSITRAASQLGMSHAALSEWLARRGLPDGERAASP
jgi:hypothetical protein